MIKCVIVSQQGSGTNLLRSFLNSHPDIYIADEIFSNSKKFKYYKKYIDNPIKEYLNEFFESGNNFDKFDTNQHKGGYIPKIFGFDLKYNNIVDNPEIFDWLATNNPKIIHLYRCKGRTFLRGMNKENKATLSYDQFEEHIKFVNTWQDYFEYHFSQGDPKYYMKLNYEDMTRGEEINELPLKVEHNLLNFLGVRYQKLKINPERIRNGKLRMRY